MASRAALLSLARSVEGQTQLIPETTTPRPLTGRAVRFPRPLVTDCVSIDARDLKAKRFFSPSSSTSEWTATWSAPLRPAHQIVYRGVWYGLALQGLVVATLESSEGVATRRIDPTFVELTRTKPYLGGHRWWLLCPACGARVRIIYARWATTGWGCRACMGLSYRSRRFHRGWAYENITVVIARVERLKGDLASRSPRRKLRALCKLHPQSTFVALRDFVKRRKTELAAERRAGRA